MIKINDFLSNNINDTYQQFFILKSHTDNGKFIFDYDDNLGWCRARIGQQVSHKNNYYFHFFVMTQIKFNATVKNNIKHEGIRILTKKKP